MRKSKYTDRLRRLKRLPAFTSAQARSLGVPSRMLAHFAETGEVERLSRGIYRFTDTECEIDPEWEELVAIVMSIPDGTICLTSALCYYGLTDEIMREIWVAVPNASRSPHRPNTRIARMRNMELGVTEVKINNQVVQIFDRERTVVDSFRYLSKEVAIKALRAYLRPIQEKYRPDSEKLLHYARNLRVDLRPYLEALST